MALTGVDFKNQKEDANRAAKEEENTAQTSEEGEEAESEASAENKKKAVKVDFSKIPLSNEFLEGIVAFSHFTQYIDVIKKQDFIVNLIGRCAAAGLKENFPCFDLLIPVVLKGLFFFYFI